MEHIDTVNLPEWSVCYLVNGDTDNLTDKEVDMIDSWVESYKQPITLLYNQVVDIK